MKKMCVCSFSPLEYSFPYVLIASNRELGVIAYGDLLCTHYQMIRALPRYGDAVTATFAHHMLAITNVSHMTLKVSVCLVLMSLMLK